MILALEAGRRTIRADPAVDIWAIGVIAYELLSGERALPSSGLEPAEAEAAALDAISGRAALPWEGPEAAPQLEKLRGLKRTVLRCLERNPKRRPTAQALLESWDHTFDNMQSQGTVFTRTLAGMTAGATGGLRTRDAADTEAAAAAAAAAPTVPAAAPAPTSADAAVTAAVPAAAGAGAGVTMPAGPPAEGEGTEGVRLDQGGAPATYEAPGSLADPT